MKTFDTSNVINGTYGELWLDGEYMAEVKKLRLEANIEYEEVSRVRSLTPGQKMVAIKPEGEVSFNKVSSTMMKKIHAKISQGLTPKFDIISKLDDPNALGHERVAAHGCTFEKITLADWELGNLVEENYSFKFERYDLLDAI